jgi:hypothetical protein
MMWALDRFAATRHVPELPDFDPEQAFARELLATELTADYPPLQARPGWKPARAPTDA